MNRRDFLGSLTAAYAGLHAAATERVLAASQHVSADPAVAAADEDFWFQVRHAFTIDRNHINLNSGSVSPAPRVVQEAMQGYLEIMNMSPSLYVDELLGPERENVRRRLAAAFGCDTEEIAITRNTTEALFNVISGLTLEPGDEILTTTQDYPHMMTAWRQREKRDGVVLKTFPFPVPVTSLGDLTERFERAITPRTRVIMFCHVTYTTGQIFPVKEICDLARARGITTIVDGAHGFAQFPFSRDDLSCDFYGTSLHKWLTAPVGTGFLYARRDTIASVWPLMAVPEGREEDIRKFESIGTHPVANRNAITEALTFHESIGAARKAERLRYLRERWARRVESLPGVTVLNSFEPGHAYGVGAMTIDTIGARALTDYLQAKHGIHVRPRFVPGEYEDIRVTPNVFSTLDDIDTFSAAIEKVVKTGI